MNIRQARRSYYVLIAIMLLSTMITACNPSSATKSETSSNEESLKKRIGELEAEIQKLKSEEKQKTKEEAKPGVAEAKQKQVDETKPAENKIAAKKPFTIADFCEITLVRSKFTTKVAPSKPGSFYTYYEVKDADNIYVDTVLQIKSLLADGKTSDEFASVKVKYDGKYEYDAFSTIEESGGSDFTYTNITSIEPLKTRTLHFIAELPKEASTDKKPIQVIVSSNGTEHVYSMR